MTTSTDTPTFFSYKDIVQVNENHFRLKMSYGFGLDVVLLHAQSLAFRSHDGGFLDLKNGTGWPGSLFNPIIGET